MWPLWASALFIHKAGMLPSVSQTCKDIVWIVKEEWLSTCFDSQNWQFHTVQIYKELSQMPALGKHSINNRLTFLTLAWEKLKYKSPFCPKDSASPYSFSLSALTDPFAPNYSSVGLTKITERLSLGPSLWKKENFDGDFWVSVSSRFQQFQLRLNEAAQSRRLVGSLGHESGTKSPQGGPLVIRIPQPRVALARWGVLSQPFDRCSAPGPGNHRRWDSHGLIVSEGRYPPPEGDPF